MLSSRSDFVVAVGLPVSHGAEPSLAPSTVSLSRSETVVDREQAVDGGVVIAMAEGPPPALATDVRLRTCVRLWLCR